MDADSKAAAALERLKGNLRDEVAWRELVKWLYPTLFYFLYRLSDGQAELCKDVIQDVLLKFFNQVDMQTLENPASVAALLKTMSRNRLIDYVRSRQVRRSVPIDSETSDLPDPAGVDIAESNEFQLWELQRLSNRLSTEDQTLLRLVLGGQSEIPGVATALKITYAAAAVRLFRLKERLRRLVFDDIDIKK